MSVCLFVCVEGWGREFLPAMNSSAKARKCACLSQCAAAPVNVCVRVEYQHICTSECMQTSARVLAQVGAAIETATASAQDIEVCQSVSLPPLPLQPSTPEDEPACAPASKRAAALLYSLPQPAETNKRNVAGSGQG